MQLSREGLSIFLKAAPILASSVIALIIGGASGIAFFATISGLASPPTLLLDVLGAHWFLMLLGFTNGLISAEILVMLSAEWSRRPAPASIRAAFLALFWAGIALYYSGFTSPGLTAAAASLLVTGVWAVRALLSKSWIGLPPGHYNYLLTATPWIALGAVLAWLLWPAFDLAIAMVILPVTAIIAVESRDLPLLLGKPPTRSLATRSRSIAIRAVVSYLLTAAGIMAVALGARHLGGALVLAGGVGALSNVALIQSVERAGSALPPEIRKHVSRHVALSYAWIFLAGAAAIVEGLLPGSMPGFEWVFVHMITIGFMFNVIMGVDAILLYGHAGIPLNKIPKPQPLPGAMLNTGLLILTLWGAGVIGTSLTILGGVLVGLGIVAFYARNAFKIATIARA